MIEKYSFNSIYGELYTVLLDSDEKTAYIAYQNQYDCVCAETIHNVIEYLSDVKKVILIPVDNDCTQEEYEAIAYHYYAHPEALEDLKRCHPTIRTVIVKWIPFFRKGPFPVRISPGKAILVTDDKLSAPDALVEHIKRRIAKNESIPEDAVFVSNQIVSAADFFAGTFVKDEMTLRATLKLLNKTSFTRAAYEEQNIFLNLPQTPYYYMHAAIRTELDAVLDAEQYTAWYQNCLSDIVNQETAELFRLVAEDAMPCFYDALTWREACDEYTNILRDTAERLKNGSRRKHIKSIFR